MAKQKEAPSLLVKISRWLILAAILATLVVMVLCINVMRLPGDSPLALFGTGKTVEPTVETEPKPIIIPEPTDEETVPVTTHPFEPEHVVARATIGAMGDVMMDLPIINAFEQRDGSYQFDQIFQHIRSYVNTVDYAVISLETTLAGLETGYRYSGFGNVNCPDEIASSIASAGFDMVLTANEHSYDTGLAGLTRTLRVLQSAGLKTLGTTENPRAPKYTIVTIGGIRVGMIDYTMISPVPNDGEPGRLYLGNQLVDEWDEGCISTFNPDRPDLLFADLEQCMEEMDAFGADATVVYLHWGKAYNTKIADYQKAIAQRLCDMGVDVIVGSHPHVQQQMELLTSQTDPSHKMLCLYSLGNAFSNQRAGSVSKISSSHTEDGCWVTFTLAKYSDGKVYVESVEHIPTWVDVRFGMTRVYTILPLNPAYRDTWDIDFDLGETDAKNIRNSVIRTTKVLGSSLEATQKALQTAWEQREAAYFAAWVR